MLVVTNEFAERNLDTDFGDAFAESAMASKLDREIDETIRMYESQPAISFDRVYASTWM